MIELPNICADVVETYRKKSKRYRCDTNRSSSIGYFVPELNGCVRKGVYERTEWSQKKLYEPTTLMIFSEGDLQEGKVTKDLAEAGWEIIQAQSPFELKGRSGEVLCSGHLDGKIMFNVKDEDGKEIILPVPIEIKSAHPNIYSSIHTLEDFKKKPWLTAYLGQIQMYMLGNNIDTALFIFKNKSSGMIKQIPVELDLELAEACLRTCEEINKHVANKTIPDRVDDRDTCKNCAFNHICLPDQDFGVEIEIGDDPSFEAKLDTYFKDETIAKENAKLYKDIIQPRIKATAKDGVVNMVLGKYHITGKTAKNGSFRSKIVLIEEETND